MQGLGCGVQGTFTAATELRLARFLWRLTQFLEQLPAGQAPVS